MTRAIAEAAGLVHFGSPSRARSRCDYLRDAARPDARLCRSAAMRVDTGDSLSLGTRISAASIGWPMFTPAPASAADSRPMRQPVPARRRGSRAGCPAPGCGSWVRKAVPSAVDQAVRASVRTPPWPGGCGPGAGRRAGSPGQGSAGNRPVKNSENNLKLEIGLFLSFGRLILGYNLNSELGPFLFFGTFNYYVLGLATRSLGSGNLDFWD
ncbi:hypothetical protein FQA39_LY19335 [Lamprigera yunnana]|nr:hypothetical protein FQA39_LY19335 [Lamprigera yunnana]